MAPIPLFVFLLSSQFVLFSSAEEKSYHGDCPPFRCGKLGGLVFPFNNKTHPDCGLYTVDCNEKVQKIQLKRGGHWYEVEYVTAALSIAINDTQLKRDLNPHSCKSIESFSLPSPSVISNMSTPISLTLFNCSPSLKFTSRKEFNHTRCGDYDIYSTVLNNSSRPLEKKYIRSLGFPEQCSIIELPAGYNRTLNTPSFPSSEFTLDVNVSSACYECYLDGGECQTINTTNEFFCFKVRKGKNKNKEALKLGLGIGVSLLVTSLIIFYYVWRLYKRKRSASKFLSRNISDTYINSDPEGISAYCGVHVFPYKVLEEATNNFNAEKELGDGGFGTVYHGKLKDGREVAVKRLYEHNYKRVEQFINEIEILTRLRHKNLVSLYGCTSRCSRELLLVYEYIPNGTVADHLHGDRAKVGALTWPIRMSIATETASALAYLHASDVVHRDVKTNNILLDNNFGVKVADFGLSRLFPNDVTHVSTAPQGTPGYVDPEYHQCYQLTSKSDVYSFGVVLVELISSMPAVDITRHRHEINLSNLAICKIQKRAHNELVDPYLGFDSNNEVKTMIIAVAELAFQCLQQDTEMRPSMDEVLEILNSIRAGNNETHNDKKDESFDDSGLSMSAVRPPPSPDCDEVGLLKRMRQEQPPSPNTVTENWPSSRSTTPNISG